MRSRWLNWLFSSGRSTDTPAVLFAGDAPDFAIASASSSSAAAAATAAFDGHREAEQRIEHARRSKETTLSLHGLQLSRVPDSIAELRQLTKLALDQNVLTELSPRVCQLTALTRLSLHRNRFDTLPADLCLLVNLEELDVYRCSLHVLPPQIGALTKLTKLWLHNNKLFRLPPQIGLLVNLKELRVSDNQLLSVPPEIGRLVNLVRLSLAGNQLSSLPHELSYLTRLAWLTCHGNPWQPDLRPHLWSSPWFDEDRIRKILRIVAAHTPPVAVAASTPPVSLPTAAAAVAAPSPHSMRRAVQSHSAAADDDDDNHRLLLHINNDNDEPLPKDSPAPRWPCLPRRLLTCSLLAVLLFLLASAALLLAVGRPSSDNNADATLPAQRSATLLPRLWWLPFVHFDDTDNDDKSSLPDDDTDSSIDDHQHSLDDDTDNRADDDRGRDRAVSIHIYAAAKLARERPSEQSCKNTRQGSLAVTDDLGYLCSREQLDAQRPGCCLRRSPRFVCTRCQQHRNGTLSCCQSFEDCVSCCMEPGNLANIEKTLDTQAKLTSLMFPQHRFMICDAVCRTSSASMVQEKAYLCPDHRYCYDLIPAIREGVSPRRRDDYL